MIERICYGLTTATIPHPSTLFREGEGGGRVGNKRKELSLGKWGVRVKSF